MFAILTNCIVECPAWIGDAEDDIFFKGQPEKVRDALGSKGTYRLLTRADGAGSHCHVGAATFLNATVLDWFESIIN
jgi:hypothetical protein